MARSTDTPVYTDDGVPPAVPGGPARAGRGGRSWRDMLYSMAVLLVPVLVGLGIWQYLASDRQVNTVDTRPAVTQARQAHRFDVLVPHNLPHSWKPTSAATTVSGPVATLRVGYVTPSGGFAQLVESNRDAAKLLSDAVPANARPTGSERVAGHDWARYTGDKNREVLALMQPHRTVLIVGQIDDTELRALASSLH